MLSEKGETAVVKTQCKEDVEISILNTDPEVIHTSVLLLDGPEFGNFVLPPREDVATILVGNFSVSRSCAFIKSASSPNGTSVNGFRIISGMESAFQITEPRALFLSTSLKTGSCFNKIIQKIIGIY